MTGKGKSEDGFFATADITAGRLNDVIKNLGRQLRISDPKEVVRLINSGQCEINRLARCWKEIDGSIHLSVTSDGMTGPEWYGLLEDCGGRPSKWVKEMLFSPDFKPTQGAMTNIVILKGRQFVGKDLSTESVCTEAGRSSLVRPNAEVACLLWRLLSAKDIKAMGFSGGIVPMHEPIKDHDEFPRVLVVHSGQGVSFVQSCQCEPGRMWGVGDGFAFAKASERSFITGMGT